jgi:hypothetical protein
MSKSKDKMVIFLVLSILAGLILVWYGGTQGWFKFVFNINNPPYTIAPPDVIVILDRPPTTLETCTLAITPQAVFTGDSVTGIIQDGANRQCDIYARGTAEGAETWRLIFSGRTDTTGRLSSTQNIELLGEFRFKALCGTCITNEVTLYVNEIPLSTCAERAAAGGYFYKEPITSSFDCNQVAITECEKKGLAALSYNLDRSNCCMYKCQSDSTPCTDSDGVNKNIGGYVTVGGMTYVDDCTATMMVKEYICNGDSLGSTLLYCDPGTTCIASPSGDFCSPGLSPDSDGDGYSDAEEIQAGTDPHNSYDYPNSPLNQCLATCVGSGWQGATIHATDESSCLTLGKQYCQEDGYPAPFCTQSSLVNPGCCCYNCV